MLIRLCLTSAWSCLCLCCSGNHKINKKIPIKLHQRGVAERRNITEIVDEKQEVVQESLCRRRHRSVFSIEKKDLGTNGKTTTEKEINTDCVIYRTSRLLMETLAFAASTACSIMVPKIICASFLRIHE